LPELLKTFVGNEHSAAVLLERFAEFAIGDVDRLLAQRLVGFLRRLVGFWLGGFSRWRFRIGALFRFGRG